MIGLGLIERVTDQFMQGNSYDKLLEEVKDEIDNLNSQQFVTKVEPKKGYYTLTVFGKGFIRACKEAAND